MTWSGNSTCDTCGGKFGGGRPLTMTRPPSGHPLVAATTSNAMNVSVLRNVRLTSLPMATRNGRSRLRGPRSITSPPHRMACHCGLASGSLMVACPSASIAARAKRCTPSSANQAGPWRVGQDQTDAALWGGRGHGLAALRGGSGRASRQGIAGWERPEGAGAGLCEHACLRTRTKPSA